MFLDNLGKRFSADLSALDLLAGCKRAAEHTHSGGAWIGSGFDKYTPSCAWGIQELPTDSNQHWQVRSELN